MNVNDTATKPSAFVWTGDLEDDCHCLWHGLTAHAECMGPNECDKCGYLCGDCWYCSVSVAVMKDGKPWSGEQLFHTSEEDVRPLTGAAARKLCELVMDRHWYRKTSQVLLDAAELMGRRFEEQSQEVIRLRAENQNLNAQLTEADEHCTELQNRADELAR